MIPSAGFIIDYLPTDSNNALNSQISNILKSYSHSGLTGPLTSEISTISPIPEGLIEYYKDSNSETYYAFTQSYGTAFNIRMNNVNYIKVPYVPQNENIVLDNMKDIRISERGGSIFDIEIDVDENGITKTYKSTAKLRAYERGGLLEKK
jgi:hypothetical protein